jgi:hypothetical protein
MTGIVFRDDGVQAQYRVPYAPLSGGRHAMGGDALIDVINSVFYERFASAGTPQDPFFLSLLPAG